MEFFIFVEYGVNDIVQVPALGEIFEKYGMQAIAGKELAVQLDMMLCPDHVHFNEAGSAVFANRLLRTIRV